MLAKLFTYSLFGIDARPVEVEVDISPAALPKTILVGLAEAAVKESLDDDIDSVLDEIDGVLESNAEEFVRGFVQKGGQ